MPRKRRQSKQRAGSYTESHVIQLQCGLDPLPARGPEHAFGLLNSDGEFSPEQLSLMREAWPELRDEVKAMLGMW